MLKFLSIENIAVIERAELEFSAGFNVLTGETGAGKSIVIDAINAVLGVRTSKELIRAGCDSAEVSALFSELDAALASRLSDEGYPPDEDGNLLLCRRLSNSGKGFVRINGKPATVSVLKEIGKNLINIHGQHDSQALLDADRHLLYVDATAENGDLLQSYYDEFRKLNRIRKELQSLESDEDEKQRRMDLLRYQIDELEKADIRPGEMEELRQKLEITKQYETILSSLSQAIAALRGDEETNGAVDLLETAERNVSALTGDVFAGYASGLSEAASAVRDITAELDSALDTYEPYELDPDAIGQRLDLYRRLMVKYGNDEQEMLLFLEKARQQLENIQFSERRVAELSDLLDDSTERLIEKGEALSASRKKAAAQFEKQVCDILSYLNMPNVQFLVDFQKGKYTKRGCDTVEFLISANAGESAKPLHKIASGGELSRVMLAIKSVLLDREPVGSMIFDEIDTGISGYTAGKVGIQLKKTAGSRQVICVTHLAQIAALADRHLLIEKTVRDGRTFTGVKPLSDEPRVSEIARMMSGSDMTENLYNSAKELLDRSKKHDNL